MLARTTIPLARTTVPAAAGGGCAWSHVGARVLQGSTKGLEHPQMSPVSIPLTAPYAQLVEWLIRHHKVPCIDTHGGTVMSSTRVKALFLSLIIFELPQARKLSLLS